MKDPFLPEDNGGELDHPALVGADGFLAAPYYSPALATLPTDLSLLPEYRGCVACGGASRIRHSHGLPVPAIPEPVPLGPFVLPVPVGRGYQKIEVHTLRFGNPDWMEECAPTLDDWCARHEIPLKIRSAWDPAYPDPKFCEVDMLRDFLAGDNDWLFYLDADIVVHPLAPRPYFERAGFHIRWDRYNYIPRQRASWAAWCEKHFGMRPDKNWIYRNAGVWACDRAAAAAMLRVIEKPYHAGIMEQHHWNWWLHEASRHGMPVVDLATEWNRIPEEPVAGWMFHIYSKRKWQNLTTFRKAGVIPDRIIRRDGPLPTPPDFGKGAVVWPWLSTAADWDELWYSCQSVLAHWSEKDWPLVLLGDRCPSWWPGIFIQAESYEHALWLGTQCADNVLWMNDDIFLLADQSPDTHRHARHLGDMRDRLGETMVSLNSWRRGLGQVLMRLHHHGKSVFNFSTHTPYLYQRERVREIFDRFGLFWKQPFETAYFNWHGIPAVPITEKSKGPHDLDGPLWINPAFVRVTPEFRKEMARRFGSPHPT